MIVIVTGGRDKRDMAAAFTHLDRIDAERGITGIVEGGQRTHDPITKEIIGGADYFAFRWAVSRGKFAYKQEADWKAFGRRAGPIRNELMLVRFKPQAVINMTGGRGTADMVSKAIAASVEVIDAPID